MYKEVEKFAVAMNDKLVANERKGSWKECNTHYLIVRLAEEVAELERALTDGFGNDPNNRAKILAECADIANFAMFIADTNKAL